MGFGKVTSIYYYLMTHTSVYPTVEKILKLFLKKRSSTTSKQNIHINRQRTRLCELQIFLSMYFVYGLKTLKSCLAICSSNITLKKCVHGSFFIKKNRPYRDKIFTIIIRNIQFGAYNWFIWTLDSFYSLWLLLNPEWFNCNLKLNLKPVFNT